MNHPYIYYSVVPHRSTSVNVLVTSTRLAPALAKVLLYGIGSSFKVDNIYSAAKVGELFYGKLQRSVDITYCITTRILI